MFITRCIEKGIDAKVVAQWQGHPEHVQPCAQRPRRGNGEKIGVKARSLCKIFHQQSRLGIPDASDECLVVLVGKEAESDGGESDGTGYPLFPDGAAVSDALDGCLEVLAGKDVDQGATGSRFDTRQGASTGHKRLRTLFSEQCGRRNQRQNAEKCGRVTKMRDIDPVVIFYFGTPSSTDWNALLQTAGTWAGALILLWYTFETYRLRKAGERQVNIAQQQANLTEREFALSQEQTRMNREAIDRDVQQQIRDSQPVFASHYSMVSGNEWSGQFVNVGGRVTDLEISTALTHTISVSPAQAVERHGQCKITARLPHPQQAFPPDWTFEIRYMTRLNQIGAKVFRVGTGGHPQEINLG